MRAAFGDRPVVVCRPRQRRTRSDAAVPPPHQKEEASPLLRARAHTHDNDLPKQRVFFFHGGFLFFLLLPFEIFFSVGAALSMRALLRSAPDSINKREIDKKGWDGFVVRARARGQRHRRSQFHLFVFFFSKGGKM
ncbi:hypothetical protein TW95_gp1460 [Pandoravirus inopinatum]|uniref:Uncharacterized protein n=1 Tax=Pandoravirus inopinatum TaxID=1605721 RepID=A0A0B5J3P6_9VIRU|nr:hypothetical protein TW95_gp1460 [Pandoravirus inopinatum]AJF98194.1 hypothetical protein [Pandoravirus inopinatum]